MQGPAHMKFSLPGVAHRFSHVTQGLPDIRRNFFVIPHNFSVIPHKEFHVTHKADFMFFKHPTGPNRKAMPGSCFGNKTINPAAVARRRPCPA